MSNTNTDLQNGVGTVFYDTMRDGAYNGGVSADLKVFPKTAAYTFTPGQVGHIHPISSGSALTVTVPNNLPVGWYVTLIETGAGQVTIAAASGATILKTANTLKMSATNAVVHLYCISNVDGVSAVVVAQGDLAAS